MLKLTKSTSRSKGPRGSLQLKEYINSHILLAYVTRCFEAYGKTREVAWMIKPHIGVQFYQGNRVRKG